METSEHYAERLNIMRFTDLLASETDTTKRQTLTNLLNDELSKREIRTGTR